MKEKQFQKLVDKANEEKSMVRHRNEFEEVDAVELLAGDVIKIENGKKIPADCILIKGIDLQLDESSMTGEAEVILKFPVDEKSYSSNPDPFLLAKTMVTNGEGEALVCAVGINSYSGKIEEKLHLEDDLTPLQVKLGVIANTIGGVGVAVAILTFTALTTRMVFRIIQSEDLSFLSA